MSSNSTTNRDSGTSNSASKKNMNVLDGIKGKLPEDRRMNLTEDSLRSRGSHRRTNSREIDNVSYDIDLDDKILDASHALLAINIGGGSLRGSGGELNSLVLQNQPQTSTAGSAVGSAATPSTSDTEADVVTSTKKKNKHVLYLNFLLFQDERRLLHVSFEHCFLTDWALA